MHFNAVFHGSMISIFGTKIYIFPTLWSKLKIVGVFLLFFLYLLKTLIVGAC